MEKTELDDLFNKIKSSIPKNLFDKYDKAEVGNLKVLLLLVEKGEMSAGKLAEEMNVSTARIAVLVHKMEQERLVITSQSPKDKRKILIQITEAGRMKVIQWKEEMYELLSAVVEEIGKEKMMQFIDLSIQIRRVFDKRI